MKDIVTEKDVIAQNDESQIINVIDEFDYSTQQEDYNKHFIAWRKDKGNPYAYNFVHDKKETVFIEGQGFVDTCAADAEWSVLEKILSVIGIAMLSLTLIEDVLDKVIVSLLDIMGVDIHCSFSSSVIYGGRAEVVVMLILVTVAKYAVPLYIVHSKFKMPERVRCPRSLNDPAELIATLAVTLMGSVILGVFDEYIEETRDIFTFFKGYDADVSVWGQNEFVIYTIFDILIVSIISEVLFRGEMLAVLRQFGDAYAVIVTAILTGLLTQNFSLMLGSTVIAAVSAVGTLRSGTIATAVLARVVYKVYQLVLTMIETGDFEDTARVRTIYLAIMFGVGFITFVIVFINKQRRERTIFASYNAHVSLNKKLTGTVKVLPMMAAIAVCLLAALLRVLF